MSGRPPPNIDGMVSLKIDNLSYRTDLETLRRKFGKYGDIGDVYVPKDKYGGKHVSSLKRLSKPIFQSHVASLLSDFMTKETPKMQ